MFSRPDWLTFERYTATATGMAGLLIALGIYTAASGSGLACAQQWPLCDGGVLPQTIPSFVEWFHRLWAMVTGFVIAGAALWAWRRDVPRSTTTAAVVAAVLTPMQAVFGAITVTLEGAVPGGYSAPIHAAHFVTGVSIFLGLTYATLTVAEGSLGRSLVDRTETALRVAVGGVLAGLVLSRAVPLVQFGPWVQAAFYLVSLATLAALVASVRWLGQAGRSRLRVTTGVAALALAGTMVLGRDLVFYSGAVRIVNLLLVLLAVALVAGTAWSFDGEDGPDVGRSRVATDD
jgi:cytochrome c oxidase assembly protein subunit 15